MGGGRELKAEGRRGPRGNRDPEAVVLARIDDGAKWPTAFALLELTTVEGATLGALTRKAIG